jgi:glycerophosphoryl diester phosphodiesterase
LDYHHSRDGTLVVLHDYTFDRTKDATNRWGGRSLKVADCPLAELRELQAFDWDYLRDFGRLEPGQVLGALGPPSMREGRKLDEFEKFLNPAWLDEIKSIGAQAVVWNKQLDAAAVKAAHERGLKVWNYTINDEATAGQLLTADVDGIITDNPAIIWKALAIAPREVSERRWPSVTSRKASETERAPPRWTVQNLDTLPSTRMRCRRM